MSTFNKMKISAVIALSGCTAVPTVQYAKVTRDDITQLKGTEIDSYYLSASVIRISRKQVDGKPTDDVVVQSMPVEFSNMKLALTKADPPWVKTNVNIVKVENTDLVQEIGTEVVDNRIEYINKIGGAVVKLVGIAGLENQVSLDDLPIEIRLVEKNSQEMGINGGPVKLHEGPLTIDISQIPVDAQAIDGISFPLTSSSFFYSACREATVTFSISAGKDKQGNDLLLKHVHTLKVADPRYVQRVAFPVKGKIKSHSECGVSVQTDKDNGVASQAALIEAVANQAAAIKEAHDKNSTSSGK